MAMLVLLILLGVVLLAVGVYAVAAAARRIPAHITAALSRAPMSTEEDRDV